MKKLLVSFSGGETSGYMAKYLIDNKSDEYEMVFVFANTGEENEATLKFVDQCDKHFGLNVVWVEAKVNPIKGKGIRHRIVDYKTASRNGKPFEDLIKKSGIPNMAAPFCSEKLKKLPIESYMKSIGWKNYYKAIGIRSDEIDRVSPNRIAQKVIYPFVEMKDTTKPEVNFWWSKQPFRLPLKGYEGNCKVCWKKSLRKLGTIGKYNPQHFDFFKRMEDEYEDFKPAVPRDGTENKIEGKVRFFRNDKTVAEMLEVHKDPRFEDAKDDSRFYNFQTTMGFEDFDSSNGCEESCEAF